MATAVTLTVTPNDFSHYVQTRRPWFTLYGLRLRPGGPKTEVCEQSARFNLYLAAMRQLVVQGHFGGRSLFLPEQVPAMPAARHSASCNTYVMLMQSPPLRS